MAGDLATRPGDCGGGENDAGADAYPPRRRRCPEDPFPKAPFPETPFPAATASNPGGRLHRHDTGSLLNTRTLASLARVPEGAGYCRCPQHPRLVLQRRVPAGGAKVPPVRISLGIDARGAGRSLQLPRGLARAAVATGLAGSLGVPIAVGDEYEMPIANQTAHIPIASYTAVA